MSRPRLRSVNGCLCCRRRRTKCDEVHPTCHNCQRLGFVCEWPPSQKGLSNDLQHIAIALPVAVTRLPVSRTRHVSNGYHASKDSTSYQLFMASIDFIMPHLNPQARSESGGMSVIITVGLQQEWIRSAIIGYSALMHYRYSAAPLQRAYQSYALACASLRLHLKPCPENTTTNEVSCLICVLFLGFFESTLKVPPAASLAHFAAAATILSHATWVERLPQMQYVLRFAAESLTYHCMLLGFLYSGCDNILRRINMKGLGKVAMPTTEPLSDFHRTSPVSGVLIGLTSIACQAIIYGRENHPEHARKHVVAQWQEAVSTFEFQWPRFALGISASTFEVLRLRVVLYSRALNILLLKINGDAKHSLQDIVQREVELGFAAISIWQWDSTQDQGFLWPMLVILCVLHDRERYDILETKLDRDMTRVAPAHRRWLEMALVEIRRHRYLDGSEDMANGLDLLVRPEGLLGQLQV